MPTRGYRKGISDRKTPRPYVLRCRASTPTRETLLADAASRSITLSTLAAEVLDAYVDHRRVELPHARGPSSAALRELARLGNNLNQIARAANTMKLHLVEAEARSAMAALNDAARRLA